MHARQLRRYSLLALLISGTALAACNAGKQDNGEMPETERPAAQGRGDTAAVDSAPGAESGRARDLAFAVAELSPTENSTVSGNVRFTADGGLVSISGEVSGLESGLHGLHVHANGDCSSPDAKSAGGHFSPDDDPHGAPVDPEAEHHVGDLGNIAADDQGYAQFNIVDTEMSLADEPESVVGRAVIVHAGKDDLESQPSGDAGKRVACGVIEPAS